MRTLSRWIICAVSWILWRNTTAFFLVKPDLIRTPNDTQNWQSRRINLSIQQRPKRRWEILSNPGSDSKDTEEYLQDPKFVERNKRWIIIVDDEEAIRMAVGDFLYDRGYQVTACADADSMLDLLTVSDDVESTGDILLTFPDAIISDVRMPGKDGIELLGLIRSDPRLVRVPIVLLTAKAMAQDRVQGYKAGADVYLPKPFDPDELLSIVDNLILRRQQMSGKVGGLMDLKDDMEKIKQIMKRNSANVVKKTNVFLTDMERDVLELLCKGFTNSEIAEQRDVSIIGINRVIQNIYTKTETRNRTELVRWAISTGYVPTR